MDARKPVGEQDVQVGASPEDAPPPVDDVAVSVEAVTPTALIPGPPAAREAAAVAMPEACVANSLSAESETMFTQDSSTGEGRASMGVPARHCCPTSTADYI